MAITGISNAAPITSTGIPGATGSTPTPSTQAAPAFTPTPSPATNQATEGGGFIGDTISSMISGVQKGWDQLTDSMQNAMKSSPTGSLDEATVSAYDRKSDGYLNTIKLLKDIQDKRNQAVQIWLQ